MKQLISKIKKNMRLDTGVFYLFTWQEFEHHCIFLSLLNILLVALCIQDSKVQIPKVCAYSIQSKEQQTFPDLYLIILIILHSNIDFRRKHISLELLYHNQSIWPIWLNVQLRINSVNIEIDFYFFFSN